MTAMSARDIGVAGGFGETNSVTAAFHKAIGLTRTEYRWFVT
jgi:transcriptional regulator GlxA family with amidase domain